MGAGASGGTLAAHLARAGVDVCVVEGGPTINTRTDFNTHALPFHFTNRAIPTLKPRKPGMDSNSTPSRKARRLPGPPQIAILTPLSEAAGGHGRLPPEVSLFRAVKNLTADGYYTSQIGLIDELGYRGNTVHGAFPECTHEH